jgi:DnaJ-class molecular chaperone
MKFQDYYEILGVKRGATTDEINAAFRKLAMKWHPDRHPGEGRAAAEEKFKRINEAKEVLTDPEKRAKYDKFGQNWEHGQDFKPPQGGGWQTMDPNEFASIFGEGGGGFSDFFASMFGEDMRSRVGGRTQRRYQARGADANAELALTISDAIEGGKREFAIGTQQPCPTCGGTGEIGNHVCPTCAGMAQVRGHKTVELKIPKDVRDGLVLRLKGLGEAGHGGGEAGDLYLTIRLRGDASYRREGADVYADVPVAPWEAQQGAKVDVRTLDGTVTLNVPANSKSGQHLRLKGLGLSHEQGGRGDLYAVLRLAMPEQPSAKQKDLISELGKAGPTEIKGGARK